MGEQIQKGIDLLSYMKEVGERVSIDKYLLKLQNSPNMTMNFMLNNNITEMVIENNTNELNPSSKLDASIPDKNPYLDEKRIKEEIANRTQYCFHVPPFNSINHLHLHVITLPFLSTKHWLKYSTKMPWCCTHQEVLTSLLSIK